MILGREPIHFLRQSVTLLLLTAPHICLGQNKPQQEDNGWATKSPDKIPEARAEARPSQVEAQARPGGFRDPWSGNQPDGLDSPAKPTEEMPGPSEPRSRDYWDDYEGSSHSQPPQFEESRHGHVRSIVPNYSLWLGAAAGWT